MRIIETKVYEFNELSESAKDKAREWFRALIDSSDYAESVIDDAKRIGALMGITVDKVFCSRF